VNLTRIASLILYGLSATPVAFAQGAPAAVTAAPATREIVVPSYPDTAQGLEKFAGTMMALAKAGDSVTLAAYTKSLTLPDPDVWYKEAFGEQLGAAYAAATLQARSTIGRSVPATLATVIKDKMSRIEAHKFEQSCDVEATGKEYPLLLKRHSLIPLYDVRFWAVGSGSIWMYFAYVDGGFRYAGELPAQLPAPPKGPRSSPSAESDSPSPGNVRIGANVQAAKLIHEVAPRYPNEARRAHVKGSVILHAIIGKDGAVRDLSVVEGVCSLSEAAVDAVKTWLYQPTLINGEPVEVDTTITVIFTLGRQGTP
jgi:TonB family protein